jgi:RNA polymerase sigma factor (sigma-70 family)
MQSYELLVIAIRSEQCAPSQRHAAFAQLVAQFHPMVVTYAYQLLGDAQLAQDVTQEAFLTAYQQLDQLREPAAFPGWLRRLVHTHCHRFTRVKRPESLSFEALETTLITTEDLAQLVADADATQAIIACVLGAVADLPEHERAVVQLFYFDGYSIRAVAQALKLPVTTIKKRLQYARDRLRRHLTDHFKGGGLTMQTWALQAGQWLLPLLAVFGAPPLCPSFVTSRRVHR